MATSLKRPELKHGGNTVENFEVRFDDYCIQANYRDLEKDPLTERAEYYKKPVLEISALRSAMPDEALQVIRYTTEPQISEDDKKKTMDMDGETTASIYRNSRKFVDG